MSYEYQLVGRVLLLESPAHRFYHSINNCGNTDASKATQITKIQAEVLGLGPCSKCWQHLRGKDISIIE